MDRLAPAVAKPRARLRIGFVVALLLAMAIALVALLVRSHPPPAAASDWWTTHPHCTPLEVALTIEDRSLSDGERAICLAVAGKIDDARAVLAAMAGPDRREAVEALFSIAHPIADSGDDRSAGPIMSLVVELWPDNYMAVFHAGMAEFAMGHDAQARAHLERFLGMYQPEDIWRQRAEQALSEIASHVALPERHAHFDE
ncbi:MAG TPA: hypothetical protein VLX92_12355 [Kofleriaceae bacterium]|nr:hypothetical protein [Kofleriaceae bacterium]